MSRLVGTHSKEDEVRSILLFAQFIEKNNIYPLLPPDQYNSLVQIIKENFHLYNDDILRGVITAALEYRDNNHAITTKVNALGDWGMIIDTIKIVLQEKRETASKNFQELVQYGLAGDQGNVDKYLLKLYKNHQIDHLFLGVLEETKTTCQQSGNEENFYMVQYFCNTLDSIRENEMKIKLALSKKAVTVSPAAPNTATTTAATTTSKPVVASVPEKPIAAPVTDKTPVTLTTTTATATLVPVVTKADHSETDLLAAGQFLHDLIKQCAGNMQQVQTEVLKMLSNPPFPIPSFQQVITDNILACEQANYANKKKLFQFLDKFVRKHVEQQGQEGSVSLVESSLQRLANEQQDINQAQQISSMTSHHAPQFVTNNTLYDQYQYQQDGAVAADGDAEKVKSWKTKLMPQPINTNNCFDGRKIDFYAHPTNTTGTTSASSSSEQQTTTKMNPKKLKATKKLYKNKLQTLLQQINTHLDVHGYVVIDSFVPLELVKRVRIESMLFTEFYEKSEIWIGKEANIGAHLVVPSIRGDQVLWMCGGHNVFVVDNPQLEQSDQKRNNQHFAPEGITRIIKTSGEVEPCKLEVKASAPTRRFHALKELIFKCDSFVNSLKGSNVQLEGIFERSDAMLAIFPGEGARFANHVDNTTFDGRRVTMVTYLNPNWTESDGGALRITGRLQQRKFVPPNNTTNSSNATATNATSTAASAIVNDTKAEEQKEKKKKDHKEQHHQDSDDEEDEEDDDEEGLPAIVSEAQLHAENNKVNNNAQQQQQTPAVVVNEQAVIDVLPVAGRVALFYSSEIPHEVLPSFGERYAMTIWYYDRIERQHAIDQAKQHAIDTAAKHNNANNTNHNHSKANMQAQIEAKQFIGLLMGDNEYHAAKVTRELQAEGVLPGGVSNPDTAIISTKELITIKELKHLQTQVINLSSDAIEIVASITGAPSVQSFRDGFAMLTVQDIVSMRALFRKMGLHD